MMKNMVKPCFAEAVGTFAKADYNNKNIFKNVLTEKIRLIALVCILWLAGWNVAAQTPDQKTAIAEWLLQYELRYPVMGTFSLKNVQINHKKKTCHIFANNNFESIPFREELVEQMQQEIISLLGDSYRDYKIIIYANNRDISTLIPNYYRTRNKPDKSRLSPTKKTSVPFVVNHSKPFSAPLGLDNRYIALWHSHGWHYDQRLDRWEWQRARILSTVEDKFTMSYVLPYLLPMLENAGATVFLPRERDTQTHEVIVDNDTQSESLYIENGKENSFTTGGTGFAMRRTVYTEQQNPFTEGSYRIMHSDVSESSSVIWIPNIPEDGYYSVSVSYKSVNDGVGDARYSVFHTGGITHFTVNQTIGGGTWIYLGNFHFKKGINNAFGCVALSNQSAFSKHVITADAVRFGGGMGNIARRPAREGTLDNVKSSASSAPKLLSSYKKEEYLTSGRARYLEGARYWMQWAGIPFHIYSYTQGLNDYIDDYASRGCWVNYLLYGSHHAPDSVGLAIPVDMALAFHSDAGCKTDTIIGTLGIYTAESKHREIGRYLNGQSRSAARDLTDMVTTAITDDIRRLYEPNWTRRGMWNKSYAEARIPEVPTILLELLSHQNFLDMQYGHDPRFKFTVCRAIYKGILRFLATQNGQPYCVQPLPVTGFSTRIIGDSVLLQWQPVMDTLEATAVPDSYIIYQRREDNGFDNGISVCDTFIMLPLPAGEIMSYKVTAVNEGGESFPSEILSAFRYAGETKKLLIVNGFDRVAAPSGFAAGDYAGFPAWTDRGVADWNDLSFTGMQYEYRRSKLWNDDDAPGFGASGSDYETVIIAGNTFDYPYLHGRSIAKAGYSFESCSYKAVEDGRISMSDYPVVDYILGKQKTSPVGTNSLINQYKTFSPEMQRHIKAYCQSGGALFVSGAHVGADLWAETASDADRRFAEETLKFIWRTANATQDGRVAAVYAPNNAIGGNYQFSHTPNSTIYFVDAPDGIDPVGGSHTVMRYPQSNISAAVAYRGAYRTLVCGFPFETVNDEAQRNSLMQQILYFLFIK
ncbi:MAG: xanthan lyase [Prevotellaceae bacterium]|jgi:hypothetical protein|nr:xanthan lyase [Prevotellaceae bacterium]